MKKNWWNSLRTKIIAWSFVPTVIILSAVAWFTFYSYQKVIGDLAIKQYPEIIQPKVLAFAQAFNGLFNPIVVPIILGISIRTMNCPSKSVLRISLTRHRAWIFLTGVSIFWINKERYSKPSPHNLS